MKERKEPDFDADPFLQVDKWAPETPEDTPTDLAYQVLIESCNIFSKVPLRPLAIALMEKIRDAENLGVLEVIHVTEALILFK